MAMHPRRSALQNAAEEPSNILDTANGIQVMELIQHLKYEGGSVFFSATYDLRFV